MHCSRSHPSTFSFIHPPALPKALHTFTIGQSSIEVGVGRVATEHVSISPHHCSTSCVPDIKPSNVLLHGDISSGNYQVKVTDFGVAADLNSSRERTAETGTYRWMSPEVIRHENYTEKADVYSYAILVWQLVTREEPFADKSQIEAAIGVSMESARPPLPARTPEALSNLLLKAWANNPQDRPSFEEISELLTDMESGLSLEAKRWLDAPLGHHVYNRVQDDDDDSGVEIKALDLELLGKHHPPKVNFKAVHGKKRGKKFSLFTRKSSHF